MSIRQQAMPAVLSKKEMTMLLKRSVSEWNTWRSGRSVDLSHADLSYADLTGANLRHVSFVCANLSNTKLVNVDFEGADLRGVNFIYATMSRELLTLFQKASCQTVNLLE